MGNLWNKIHDFFDVDDGTYPEICICRLSKTSICESYEFIRNNSSLVMGQKFLSYQENGPVALDNVKNAAELVCDGLAEPFHFIVRNVQITKRAYLQEIGVYVLNNAIALDYAKNLLWGELEILMLFKLMAKIMQKSPNSFLRLEDCVSKEDKERFNSAFSEFLAGEYKLS